MYGSPTTGTVRVYANHVPSPSAANTLFIDLLPQHYEMLYSWCEWKYWRRRREPDEASGAKKIYFDILSQVANDIEEQIQNGAILHGRHNR